MRSRFFPKTWPWPGKRERRNEPAAALERTIENGSTSFIAIFLLFLFTALGFGLHYLSQSYLRISAYKKFSFCLEITAENGIKQGLGRLLAGLVREPGPRSLTEEERNFLAQDASSGGGRAAEEAMAIRFPFRSDDEAGDQSWSGNVNCMLNRFTDEQTYFLAEYRIAIDSEGRIKGLRPGRTAGLDLSLDVLAGRIPLASFPFLLAGAAGNGFIADLLDRQKLVLAACRRKDLTPRNLVTPRLLSPRDASPLLARALNIKLLEPGRIGRALLRRSLGLEMIDAPIPEGVYLIRNDAGPGGVFVQGDLDRMLMAADGGRQYLQFESTGSVWKIKFGPLSGTEFFTPTGIQTDIHPPLGIVLVNGSVASLGAATLGVDGNLLPVRDGETPCLQDGLALTIVSAEEVTIGSSLLHEGVRWSEGVPYLAAKQSQLVVYASGSDLIDGTEKSGRILIDPAAPPEIKIQATLTAADNFEIAGGPKTIVVTGGVQASGLVLGEGILKIAPDERLVGNLLPPPLGPAAAEPVLLVLGLRPLAWR